MGARYVVKFDDIEKVTDCKELNNQIENLWVFLRLNDVCKYLSNKTFKKSILTWAYELSSGNQIDSLFDDDISEEVHDAIEQQVDGIVKQVENVLFQFKAKTDITVFWEYNYDNDKVFFELNWDDVVQFTPKVTTLDNLSVDFKLVTYDEE